MALDVSWITEAMPIFAFALVLFVVFAILKKTKVLGESNSINIIVSLILSVIFISFAGVRSLLTNMTPWFVVLIMSVFMFLLLIMFIAKDWEAAMKPITVLVMILLGIIIIASIFYTFPSTRAILPGDLDDKDSNTDSCRIRLSDYEYFDCNDCSKKDGEYKCYDNGKYEYFNTCVKQGSEYKCYDYTYKYTSCNTNSSNNSDNDVFEEFAGWFYRDKILAGFWILVVALIAILIVTKK